MRTRWKLPAAFANNLYKLEFKNAWVLSHFEFDSKGKIASLRTLGTEWKHPLPE